MKLLALFAAAQIARTMAVTSILEYPDEDATLDLLFHWQKDEHAPLGTISASLNISEHHDPVFAKPSEIKATVDLSGDEVTAAIIGAINQELRDQRTRFIGFYIDTVMRHDRLIMTGSCPGWNVIIERDNGYIRLTFETAVGGAGLVEKAPPGSTSAVVADDGAGRDGIYEDSYEGEIEAGYGHDTESHYPRYSRYPPYSPDAFS